LRMLGYPLGDPVGEAVPIHGKGLAAGHAGGVGGFEQQTAQAAQFLFQQPGRGMFGFALERVGTDELRHLVRLMGRGRAAGPHFE
jgi:hypothetical protein